MPDIRQRDGGERAPEPTPTWIVHSAGGKRALAVPVDHADVLRRELHDVADTVTPSPEGLTRIREAVQRPARRRTARIAGAFQRLRGVIAP